MKIPSPTHKATHSCAIITLLVLSVLISLTWVVEINTVLSHVGTYTGICIKCHLPSVATKKQCVHLNHRDPKFITKKNEHDCFVHREIVPVLRDLVLQAARTFNAHNLTYFLESGTLLGSYRERGIIGYDRDTDLGIDAATLAYIQTHKVEVPDDYFLAVWNSSLYPGSGRDDKLPVRLIHKETAMYTDMFAFLDWKNETTGETEVGPLPSPCFDGCGACPQTKDGKHFKVPREWVYPLVDCPFEGHTLKCPRDSAKYLEHMYGKDYMEPQH